MTRSEIDEGGGSSATAIEVGSFEQPSRLLLEDPSVVRARRRDGGALDRDKVVRRWLAGADALASSVALFAAVLLSGGSSLTPFALLLPPATVLVSKAVGLYDRDELVLHRSTLQEAPSVFQLAALFTMIVWLAESLVLDGAFGKGTFVMLLAGAFVALLGARSAARLVARRLTSSERCLFVGADETLRRLESKLTMGTTRAHVVHRISPPAGDGAAELAGLVEAFDVERVILAPGSADAEVVVSLIREAKQSGAKVSLLPRFSEILGSSVVFDELHGLTLLGVKQLLFSRSSLLLKRGFDLAMVVLCLPLVGPLMAMITLGVKLRSPGPALFRQYRVGRDGRLFRIWKFRTMVAGAEGEREGLEPLNEADGLFKILEDPRLTGFGRWLRRTSLDELPQLFNVVRGDMSLVGPRPLVPEEDRLIDGWHRERLNLPPGMTGHWQVLGSARIPLDEMVAIDYLYVANWSLWLDVKYLLRTIPYVLGRRGI